MFQDSDFNDDGNLVLPKIPEYKSGSDSDSRKEYYQVNDYCENLIKFSSYENREQLWQNYQRLTLIQQSAITLLVAGKNINQVATECHIERSTIYRWLQLDIFIECLKLWQKNLLFDADSKIKKVVAKGLEKLEFILDNPDKFEGKDYLKAIELSLSLMGKNS